MRAMASMTFTGGAPWALGIAGRPRERAAGQRPDADYTAETRCSSLGLRVDEMPYDRFSAYVFVDFLLELAIAFGQAFMLAEVFRPGGHYERFDIEIGTLEVTVDAPAKGAVATPHAPVPSDRV